nr:glycosyl hydrolase 53 family protein [Lachnospiraceae bacterium]
YIRVRVWNDPFDSEGNGYGGGNCDAAVAAEIGKRAAEYGMKLYVDFHYSDFWADPSKQQAPKAWQNMEFLEKSDALYEYTYESLVTITEAGADIGIVSLGNEINPKMCGETNWEFIAALIKRGIEAVSEIEEKYKSDIKTAVHLTNPEKPDSIYNIAAKLEKYKVPYDIMGLSYYPFWHGTTANLTTVLSTIAEKYEKEVMVAETSYAYTVEDGDGTGNSVSEKDLSKDYAASVQSQANALRDVCAAVSAVGDAGIGVFYWEPAWVPVNVYDYKAADAASVLAKNKSLWEKYGSGWASSYAAEYDPNDAGKYYGGSSWDNQALFDFTGKALPSLYTYKYLKYGTSCALKVDFWDEVVVNVVFGGTLKMPENVYVHYNDRSRSGQAKVTWNANDINKIDTTKTGSYTVKGTFEDGTELTATVNVSYRNIVPNASFEEENRTMYKIKESVSSTVDYQQKESDAKTGEWAMHYWNDSGVEFNFEQTLTGLEDGNYHFSLYSQGGDNGNAPTMYIYVKVGDKIYKQSYVTDGWCNWVNPSIDGVEVTGGTATIGVYVKAAAGAWGTVDDFYFCRTK